MVRVSVLANDCARKRNMLAEHGLSLFIEAGNRKILFDAGQTNVFAKNAQTMNINISGIDYAVISHGHYDHTGGIPEFLRNNTKAKIYTNPLAFSAKYKKLNDTENYDDIGIPWDIDSKEVDSSRFELNNKPVYIDDDMLLSGEIPDVTDYEKVSANLYTEGAEGYAPDMLLDEQMLIVKDKGGIHIFLGCSHRGVANSINHAKALFPEEKILTAAGGMHMENVSLERIKKTVMHMLNAGVQRVIPLHCTGLTAVNEMRRVYGSNCCICSAGDIIKV